MMKKDIESLSGKDNWLSEEIRRENRTSVWDFDLTKDWQTPNKQNSSIAKEKSKAHQVKQIRTKSIGNPNENMLNDDEPDERDEIISGNQSAKERRASIIWLVVDTVILVVMAIFNKAMYIRTSFAVLALYMLLYPVAFAYAAMFQKMLPAKYLIAAAIITLAMELMDIIERFF